MVEQALWLTIKVFLSIGLSVVVFRVARHFAAQGIGQNDWTTRLAVYTGAAWLGIEVAAFLVSYSCGPDGSEYCGTTFDMLTHLHGHDRVTALSAFLVTLIAGAAGVETGLRKRNSKN